MSLIRSPLEVMEVRIKTFQSTPSSAASCGSTLKRIVAFGKMSFRQIVSRHFFPQVVNTVTHTSKHTPTHPSTHTHTELRWLERKSQFEKAVDGASRRAHVSVVVVVVVGVIAAVVVVVKLLRPNRNIDVAFSFFCFGAGFSKLFLRKNTPERLILF